MMDTIICIIAAFVLFGMIAHWGRIGKPDDSDAPDSRSGLVVYTDHATGVQYLAVPSPFGMGGMTPRLNADGSIRISKIGKQG